jgi:hypothetical protein
MAQNETIPDGGSACEDWRATRPTDDQAERAGNLSLGLV